MEAPNTHLQLTQSHEQPAKITLDTEETETNEKRLLLRDVVLTLARIYGRRLVKDVRLDRPMLDGKPLQDLISIRLDLQAHFGNPSKQDVEDAVEEHCKRYQYDHVREALEALRGTWDGTPRVAGFVEHYVLNDGKRAAIDKEHRGYYREGSLFFWGSLLSRIFQPGCQADTHLMISGPKGTFKSTFARTITSLFNREPYYMGYAESDLNLSEERNVVQTVGENLVLIHDEGAGMKRTDEQAIKSLLTKRVFTYVAKYSNLHTVKPCGFVHVITCNDPEIFSDEALTRRLFHVAIPESGGKIDIEGFIRDMKQIWAEALYLYEQGRISSKPSAEFERLNARLGHDVMRDEPWKMHVDGFLEHRGPAPFKYAEVDKCLADARVFRPSTKVLSRYIQSKGYESRITRVEGIQSRYWQRTPSLGTTGTLIDFDRWKDGSGGTAARRSEAPTVPDQGPKGQNKQLDPSEAHPHTERSEVHH